MYKLKNVSGPATGTKRIMPMINGKRVRVGTEIEVSTTAPFQSYISTGQFVIVKRSRARKKVVIEESTNVSEAGPEVNNTPPPKKKRRRRKKKNAPSHTAQGEAAPGSSSQGLPTPGISDGDGGEG